MAMNDEQRYDIARGGVDDDDDDDDDEIDPARRRQYDLLLDLDGRFDYEGRISSRLIAMPATTADGGHSMENDDVDDDGDGDGDDVRSSSSAAGAASSAAAIVPHRCGLITILG